MNDYILLIILISILLINICLSKEAKYVSIPFNILEKQEQEIIDSETFVKNNFNKNYILDFYLGNPRQKINGILSENDLCFELKDIKEISIVLNEKYKPSQSSTFSFCKKESYSKWDKREFLLLGYDHISFENNNNNKYNISFLFQISEEEEININDIIPNEYIGKIGLNIPTFYTSNQCPNFIYELRKKAGLQKYTVSFEFTNSNKGNLIIGDELFNYNPKKYFQSQYINTYWNNGRKIFFNDIIIYDSNNNKNISFNETYAYLSFLLDFIIGTKEYKTDIDNIFFNKLIKDNICSADNIAFNSSHSFYIYNCKADKVDLKLFPKLIFVSKSYLYNFEFTYLDLFKKINNRFYFLILFKSNNIKENKDDWILGKTFYQKYAFTFNLDAKMIGFYNPNLPIDKNKTEINNDGNSFNTKKIIFIVLLVVGVLGLLILSFFIGMKIKDQRKKRANELKDEVYEYFPEDNNKNDTPTEKNIN